MADSLDRRWRDLGAGIAGPLAILGAIYALWWLIDTAVVIGPFDRAQLGWALVAPLWLLSPWLAALVWRRLPKTSTRLAAMVVGVVVIAAVGLDLWYVIVRENSACDAGPRTDPAGWIVPATVVALIVGGGWTAAAIQATAPLRAGRRVLSLATGVALAATTGVLTIGAFTWAILFYAGCNRPS